MDGDQGFDVMARQGTSGSPLTDDGVTFIDLVSNLNSMLGSGSLLKALRQAAFLLCVDVILQDLAKAELQLLEIVPGQPDRIVDANEHPLAAFLAIEPNDRHTWPEFIGMMGFWYAIDMNAYALVERDLVGRVTAVLPTQWGRGRQVVSGRSMFYEFSFGTEQEVALFGATFLRVPERNVIHVRGRMTDGMNGLSTLTVGRDVLDVGASIDGYREDLYSEGGQTRGVFTRDQDGVLPELAFIRLKQQLGALMRKFQSNTDPIVLEGGLKFAPIAVKPADAELTEQFEAQIVQTCRLLRVPPHKVFHLANVKYENLETMEKAYLADTMEPLMTLFDARYTKALVLPTERARYRIAHNRKALIVRDTKTEIERVTRAVERGVISRNEGRAELGYNPIPGGDTFLLPVNMMVIDANNKVVIEGKAAPAGGDGSSGGKPTGKDAPELRIVGGTDA